MKILILSVTDKEAEEIVALINAYRKGDIAVTPKADIINNILASVRPKPTKREEEVWIERIHAELGYTDDASTFIRRILHAVEQKEIPKNVINLLARMKQTDPYLVEKGLTFIPPLFQSIRYR